MAPNGLHLSRTGSDSKDRMQTLRLELANQPPCYLIEVNLEQ